MYLGKAPAITGTRIRVSTFFSILKATTILGEDNV
jgi:uncharacterized protein (DUF433 family)